MGGEHFRLSLDFTQENDKSCLISKRQIFKADAKVAEKEKRCLLLSILLINIVLGINNALFYVI